LRTVFLGAGLRVAFRLARTGLRFPLAFFFAAFFARLAVFRLGDRFATLPADFLAGFFAVFLLVAI
jgi:hypothetical protein